MVNPRITVLMPVYNAERYLREAIESILQQTFQDFEFLIIDDGSTDKSVDIVRQYDDPRIRLILNEKNLGISETLNRGIELSSCGLIARMDADDVCNPFRLFKQYNYMLAHEDVALLSSWARVVDENGKFVRLERYRSNYYYYNLTFECWMYHPTIMFRRGPVKDVGMYSMRYSEDYDLFWKVSTRYKIANLEEPLVNYRLSSTSLNTVLKKKEYEVQNEQNVLRNIRFYMGPDFGISGACLECLRHNFEPIIRDNSVEEAIASLLILDEITEKILEKENVNRNVHAIRNAHFYKRRFIITELLKGLPPVSAMLLLVNTREWMVGYGVSLQFLRRQMSKMKTLLMSL